MPPDRTHDLNKKAMIIDIIHKAGTWPDVKALITKAVHAVQSHRAITTPIQEICFVLADDEFMTRLNHTYREQEKPTNVLSFPQDIPDHLGDAILAQETIAREADAQDKTFEDHLTHLAVHGTLHLLGYDHETEDEAAEMESLEIDILRTLGVQNPYEADGFQV